MKQLSKRTVIEKKLANFFSAYRDLVKEYSRENGKFNQEDVDYVRDYLLLTVSIYNDSLDPSDLNKEFEDFFKGYRNEVGEYITATTVSCPRCGRIIYTLEDRYCRRCGTRFRQDESFSLLEEDARGVVGVYNPDITINNNHDMVYRYDWSRPYLSGNISPEYIGRVMGSDSSDARPYPLSVNE